MTLASEGVVCVRLCATSVLVCVCVCLLCLWVDVYSVCVPDVSAPVWCETVFLVRLRSYMWGVCVGVVLTFTY